MSAEAAMWGTFAGLGFCMVTCKTYAPNCIEYINFSFLASRYTSRSQNLKDSVFSLYVFGDGGQGRTEMVSCQYYMLVASRKNLLVHKDQQLEFIMSCKLSANFSQCIPPKGIFKTVWTKLFLSLVLILT